ncbi:MAG: hypothetical protein WCK92_14920 [Bacteroidota bacterium]
MPTRQQIKSAGEFYVASELSRRGYNIGLTIGNLERVDLLAEKQNVRLSIQVKAIRRRRNNSFQITNNQIVDNYWYVFVNINSENLNNYECAILRGDEVRNRLRMPQHHARNGLRISILNIAEYYNSWNRLEPEH